MRTKTKKRLKTKKMPASLVRARRRARAPYTLDNLIAYCLDRQGRRYAAILSYLLEVKEIHKVTFEAALLRRSAL